MALTRKMLKAMGIEEEIIDQIIDAHSETVDALKADRDSLKEKAEKLDKVQSELNDLKQATKNSGDYDKLKKEFDDYKTEVQQRETLAAKKSALTKLAKDAGLSEAGIAKAIKYADWNTVELDDNGDAKDAKALIKSLREEWSEHIVKTEAKGAETATPPTSTGKGKMTKEEIFAIKDMAERQKAIAENHELFGI